jgi:hypothetical protein
MNTTVTNVPAIIAVDAEQQDNSGRLQLSRITPPEDYCKKWNVTSTDFVCLTRNGKLINNTLYRVGGIGNSNISDKDYFTLLKYTEDFYKDNITKDPKRKPHLAGSWVIIDKHGVVKVEFKGLRHGYMIKNSVIYHIESDYYNIETKEHICYASAHCESSEFLFLEDRYGKDKSRRRVLKVHKQTGAWELFK